MRTVYAVTSGDYSSYHVHCLFETVELAEEYIAALQAAANAVEPNYEPSIDAGWEPFQLWDVVPVVKRTDPDDDVFWSIREQFETVAP